MHLQTELHSIQQGDKDIKTFATEIEEILQKMNVVSSKVNVGANNAIVQFRAYNEKLAQRAFVDGLKEPIGTLIKARDFPTLSATIEKALEEEIFLSKKISQNKPLEKAPNIEQITCHYCGKLGHKANVCFSKKRD